MSIAAIKKGVNRKMSSAIEKMAARAFGSYLTARGWAKQTSLPSGLLKMDLSAVTKVGVQIPTIVEKFVSVYAAKNVQYLYVKIEGEGVWRKQTEGVIRDLPGMVIDSLQSEEIAKQTEKNVKWMIVGASVLVVGIVGFMLWKSGNIKKR